MSKFILDLNRDKIKKLPHHRRTWFASACVRAWVSVWVCGCLLEREMKIDCDICAIFIICTIVRLTILSFLFFLLPLSVSSEQRQWLCQPTTSLQALPSNMHAFYQEKTLLSIHSCSHTRTHAHMHCPHTPAHFIIHWPYIEFDIAAVTSRRYNNNIL